MPQIADWLKELGLSEYAERFAESDIDARQTACVHSSWAARPGIVDSTVYGGGK